MMSQSAFSRYIGVSRKTVTTMKQVGELVMYGKKVDENKSIKKLKSLGRKFDKDNKLVKDMCEVKTKVKSDVKVNIFSEEVIPEKNLSNMSDEDLAEREKLLAEAAALKKEFENNDSVKKVDHDLEIGKLDLTEARLIKEYWAGVALKHKVERELEELIYRKDVYDAQVALGRQVREKIASRPRIAFKMVGKDVHEMEVILEEENNEILKLLGVYNV